MKPIFKYEPSSLHLRFIFAVIIALNIIFIDNFFDTFKKIRTYVETIISPFYFASNIPLEFLNTFFDTLHSNNQLKLENQALRKELFLKNSELLILDQYKKENAHFRQLLSSPLRKNEKKMITKVISNINNPYIDQIVIDKGSVNGVYEGQPVISDKGVIGQVITVSKWTSRVLLICSVTHALPIQIIRNNIRAIANGKGCDNNLQLEYLPNNVDIHIGDMLVTSGLDGRFPEGYPVAIVSSICSDILRTYTIIQAKLTANIRYLFYILLWDADHSNINKIIPEEIQQIANERLAKLVQRSNTSPTS